MQRKTPPGSGPSAVAQNQADQQARLTFTERLSAIQADFEALKRPGGQPADKDWFDGLWE
jgi:hypothetical protein